MRYFVYARKSTDTEEKQALSIEAQITELKEFAATARSAGRQPNPRLLLFIVL